MLKWTVKKRLADDDQLLHGEEINGSGSDAIGKVRKIHSRRSMGDALSDGRKVSRSSTRRRSLNDKENTPVRRRSMVGRQSSTPLNDSSNTRQQQHKASKRKHHVISPLMSPISLAKEVVFAFKEPPKPQPLFQPLSYAPTLPSFDIEYSPLRHLHQNNNNNDADDDPLTLLPAKKIKFEALDMSYEFRPESASTSSPLSTPLTARKKITPTTVANLSDSSLSPSLNSSEVGDMTLQQMIDDILASARHGKKFKQHFGGGKGRDRNANLVRPLSVVCESNMEQKSIERLLSASKIAQAAERTLIIAEEASGKNEREVKSPVEEADEEVCQLRRQNAVRRKNASNENKNRKKLSDSQRTDTNADSTIQKCLSFSSATYEDTSSEKMKRSSVASEVSSTSSSSYGSQQQQQQSKFTRNLLMKGSLELATTCDEQKRAISIHVKRCKNLLKVNESSQIHAYVKCALTFLKSSSSQNVYQRTAVHKNSTSPVFDHKFNFELTEPEDSTKFLQIAVWHRNKNLKRSEFLGCLTIPVQDVLEQNVEGAFLLQPQSSLTKPLPLVREVGVCDESSEPNNLLLKYLELNSGGSSLLGRTPLTITRVIHRQADASYGFEISWSKPPRINSICNEQLKSGVRKGDFLIFIDEVNVVSMPKEEVIELIRKQGESLKLEIFRPTTERLSSNEIIEKLAAQSTPVAGKNASSLSHEGKSVASDLVETPKSHQPCHFKQPKVHFQPSVGKGIFV